MNEDSLPQLPKKNPGIIPQLPPQPNADLQTSASPPPVPLDPPPQVIDPPKNEPPSPPQEPEKPEGNPSSVQKPENFLGNNHTMPIAKIIIGIFVFLILAIVGGSLTLAYTDYKFFSPPKPVKNIIDSIIAQTPLPKTPRIVLAKTMAEFKDLKTVVAETTMQVSTGKADFPFKNAKIVVKGPADFQTKNQTRSEFDISGEVTAEGLQLRASGTVRQVNNNLYFKVTEIPGGQAAFQEIRNQWYVVDTSQYTQENQDPKMEKKVEELVKLFEQFMAKSSAFTSLVKSESSNLYTLSVKPPKEEVDNLIFNVLEILEPKDQTNVEKDLEKENLKKFTEKLRDIEVIVQVNKKDFKITKTNTQIPFDIDIPSNIFAQPNEIQLPSLETLPITISVETKFTKYNKPFIVVIPEGAKDLTQYVEDYQNSLPQGLPEESTPGAKPQNNGQIRDLLDNKNTLGIKDKQSQPPNPLQMIFWRPQTQ